MSTKNFEWDIKGMNQTAAQSRILQTLQNNEHLIEFEIKGYDLDHKIIADHLDFFES